MSRIQKLFSPESRRKRFFAYICGLDPDFNTSLEICRHLIEAGVDLIEIGVPFSDPLADGKTNQLAAERALSNGARVEEVFELVKSVRKFSEIPIVLYTYYNLVFTLGTESYCARASEAGVDGILTLDLPPEEAKDMVAACRKHQLDRIFIIAPTTPEERIPTIVKEASGFLYYVSREGVTGERDDMVADLDVRLTLIRKYTDLPIGVGFGISTPDQVRQTACYADAVIVGSALVKLVASPGTDRSDIPNILGQKARNLIKGLR